MPTPEDLPNLDCHDRPDDSDSDVADEKLSRASSPLLEEQSKSDFDTAKDEEDNATVALDGTSPC